MGASGFFHVVSAKSANDAYQLLVDTVEPPEDDEDDADAVYSGTIATTRGFRITSLHSGETLAQFERRVLENEQLAQKWGECACLVLKPGEVTNELLAGYGISRIKPKAGEHIFVFVGWAAS